MIKVTTAKEMQSIDNLTINRYFLPADILMAYGGKHCADIIISKISKDKKILIFCGKGNNGGDGFVIASLLFLKGFDCKVYFKKNYTSSLSEESSRFYNICKKLNLIQNNYSNLSSYQIIIDCLLGNGVKGIVKDELANIINEINSNNLQVFSIDLPSGLPADGPILNDSSIIKADVTITIGLPKINLVTFPGKNYTGELLIVDIGFPENLLSSPQINITDNSFIQNFLATELTSDIYKGKRGHILIAGGFPGMEGAAMMTAMAALKIGAGLITIASLEESRSLIAGKIPEVMTIGINEKNGVETIFEKNKYNVLVVGPGMGRTLAAENIFFKILNKLATNNIKNVVIDGDGIFLLTKYLEKNKLPESINYLITPHLGEAAILLNKNIKIIEWDRYSHAIELVNKTGCSILLKGPATIITNAGLSFINSTGNSYLATGGSGDVLSGIIAAFCLLHNDILSCAAISAYLHGLSADIAINEYKLNSIKATDIIKYLPDAINKIKFNQN